MDLSALGNLGDLAKQMQDAYSEGTDAMNMAGKEVAKDMNPDHEVEISLKMSAKPEGHNYKVEAKILFDIELDPVLNSQGGDLSSVLDGLDVDLGNQKDAIMEQLGKPRAVGVVKKISDEKIEVHNSEGKVDVELNKDGTLLATIDGDTISINFESVLAYPKNTDLFISIPTMEKMQENIRTTKKDMYSKHEFTWSEKDKDDLKVSGSFVIKKK